MFSSFAAALAFFIAGKLGHPVASTTVLLATVGTTTVVWLIATFVTPPVAGASLTAFYAKVRPAGPGWTAIRRASGLPPSPDSPAQSLLGWVLGLAAVYGALFSAGQFVYGRPVGGCIWAAVSLASIAGLASVGRSLWGTRNPEDAGIPAKPG